MYPSCPLNKQGQSHLIQSGGKKILSLSNFLQQSRVMKYSANTLASIRHHYKTVHVSLEAVCQFVCTQRWQRPFTSSTQNITAKMTRECSAFSSYLLFSPPLHARRHEIKKLNSEYEQKDFHIKLSILRSHLKQYQDECHLQ